MAAGLSSCGALVRDGDHDRYLTVLAGGGERAEALFALYAFNLELARTAEVVREPLLGEIRLQWWRDALDGAAAGKPPRHPVAEALAPHLAGGALPAGPLGALIDARAADLVPEPPATLPALAAYAEATAGALNAIAAGVPEAEGAARDVGTAWGLVGLLRATPFLAGRGRVVLPRALLAEAGLGPRDVIEARDRTALAGVARQVGEAAAARLAAARRAVPRWPRGAAPAFLLAGLTDLYLERLAALGWDCFDGRLAEAPAGRAWRLARHRLRRRT